MKLEATEDLDDLGLKKGESMAVDNPYGRVAACLHFGQLKEVDEDDEESDISQMKVADLKDLAKERGVELEKGAKKADIVQALEDAEAEE